MKIEIGSYKTRGGQKADVMLIFPNDVISDYPVVGLIHTEEGLLHEAWTRYGWRLVGQRNIHDLVAVWDINDEEGK